MLPLMKFYLCVLLCLVQHLHFTGAATDQFSRWYPEFAYTYNRSLHINCTDEYNAYLHNKKNRTNIDGFTGTGPANQLVQPVVNCILEHTSDFIKSNINSAQVLLALTPTMLAIFGPTTQEISLLFVIGRRPLLALCIAAGSLAALPMRPYDQVNLVKPLKKQKGSLPLPDYLQRYPSITLLLEYFIIIAVIVNIVILGQRLGVRVVCNFAPQSTYLLVFLWVFGIIVIHIFGFVTLFIRARVSYEDDKYKNAKSSDILIRWIKRNFTPYKDKGPVWIHVNPESYWYWIFLWITTILTVCHVIFGTLVFSSMLFISVRDGLWVVSWFLGCVIFCRIVLMYELALLREHYVVNSDSMVGASQLVISEVDASQLVGSEEVQIK